MCHYTETKCYAGKDRSCVGIKWVHTRRCRGRVEGCQENPKSSLVLISQPRCDIESLNSFIMEHYNRKYAKIKGSMKLEHEAGNEVFIDFAGKKLHIIDKDTGEEVSVLFCASL